MEYCYGFGGRSFNVTMFLCMLLKYVSSVGVILFRNSRIDFVNSAYKLIHVNFFFNIMNLDKLNFGIFLN